MMKVPSKLRTAYQTQVDLNRAVREKAEDIIRGFLQPHWHYEGRIKELESYALKVESGRVPDPNALEDFFACTIVVRNAAEVPLAEAEVFRHFQVATRRPPEPSKTHKAADAFPFDDLRLYVTLGSSESRPAADIDDVGFEIQIKTFLQHAWSIATHDLLYKSNEVRWSKARIAFQIKAMLEHAELAIQEAQPLSSGELVAKTDSKTANIALVIQQISERWPSSRLPEDIKRLAENIIVALGCCGLQPTQFAELIDGETDAGRGVDSLDLSPYGAVVQGIVNRESVRFLRFLGRRNRQKMVVAESIDVPSGLAWPPASDNVVVV